MSKSHERTVQLLIEKIRLERGHRWVLDIVFSALALSGLVWLLIQYGNRDDEASWPMVWQLGALKVHGLAALLSLAALGSLWPNHIRRAWHLRRNRGLGAVLLLLALLLTLSGYLLYYFVNEDNHALISMLHWLSGLVAISLLPWHIWTGKRRLRRSPAELAKPASSPSGGKDQPPAS